MERQGPSMVHVQSVQPRPALFMELKAGKSETHDRERSFLKVQLWIVEMEW